MILKTVGIKEIARFDWSVFFKPAPVLLEKPNPVLPEKDPHFTDKFVDIMGIFGLHITDELYEIDDNGYYYLTENSGKVTSSMIIGTKTETTEEKLEIPNRINGEYDRLRLEKHDNNIIYLISDGRIKIGEDYYYNFDIKLEISFIEGDWDTFLSGGNIVMRYTEHSLNDLASLMKIFFEKELSSASFCEGNCSNFSFTVTKISNATITINKKIVHLKYDEPSNINCSFKVKVSKVHNPP